MNAQITTLLAVCDALLGHVGNLKNQDGTTPAARWAPVLNNLLDLRSVLMKERDTHTKHTAKP